MLWHSLNDREYKIIPGANEGEDVMLTTAQVVE